MLQTLEEDEPNVPIDIYAEPPHDGNDTDMDEDLSDDEHNADLNCLGPKMLRTTCEVEPRFYSESVDNTQRKRIMSADLDWDSSDDEPLSKYIRASEGGEQKNTCQEVPKDKKVRKRTVFNWKKVTPKFDMVTECAGKPPSDSAKLCENPADFFALFFTNEFLNHLLEQTNVYSAQKNNFLNMTLEEMYVFIGVLLFSGYAKYPNKRMLWSSLPDIPVIVQNSIRLNRFEQILHNFHLNDNTRIDPEDRLVKLRPIITHLNNVFQLHGGLDEDLSIDESMIPYYGKHYAKQFIKSKPIRFGFKNWALCSSFGYLIAFEIYTGKSTAKDNLFGVGGDIVVSLISQGSIPSNEGFKIFFDNYFSSSALLNYLAENGYCATSTIQDTRTGRCPLSDSKSINKKERGYYEYQTDDQEKVFLVRWKDNKSVTCITNYDNADEGTCTRYSHESRSRISVVQPKVFGNYNKGMGGVDKMDQAVAAYRTRIRQRKWWWPIFAYLLDVSVTNAWLLMRKLKPNDVNASSGLLNFRRKLAVDLLTTYGTASSRGRAIQAPSENIRYDGINHLIDYYPTERRCKLCGKKAHFICGKCNVGLHPKHCFRQFHTK